MTRPWSGASPRAVQAHYDVGNEFYQLWLDPASMSYTCALFVDGEGPEALSAAQLRKIDFHAAAVQAAGGARVLDIGCGWGNALRRLVHAHGVAQAVGLTLSPAQAEWIARQPDPRIDVRLEAWIDHRPTILYDAIVSIESIEAFVKPGTPDAERLDIYREFFGRCHAWLRPGGRLSLQLIAYGNSGPGDLDAFIAAEIFPESDLPRLSELACAVERRFEIRALVNDRAHYVRTLRAWIANLARHRAAAVALVGETVVRRYERYLRLCTYIFASGSCDLYRLSLHRIDQPRPVRPPAHSGGLPWTP